MDIETLRREFEAACQSQPLRTYTLNSEVLKWDEEYGQYPYSMTQYLFVGFCAERKSSQAEIESTAGRIAHLIESISGRILYLTGKIVDHTKNNQELIPGWRMDAIREAAIQIDQAFQGQQSVMHVGVDIGSGESRTVTEEFESGNPVDDAIERYRNSGEFADSFPEECIDDLLTIAADYERLKAEIDRLKQFEECYTRARQYIIDNGLQATTPSDGDLAEPVYDVLHSQMAEIERLKAKLSRYSVSAGMADQYKCEALACRKELGFAEDSDDVSPSDLTAKIEGLQSIVDRIPKFADGSPAFDGCPAWHPSIDCEGWVDVNMRKTPVVHRATFVSGDLYKMHKPLSECYPTREAMEKANP